MSQFPTINPRPDDLGIDPPPFRLDDPEIKFKYFWWWFNKDNPFISIKHKLPQNNMIVEGVFIYEKDQLPTNGSFFFVNGHFFFKGDKNPGQFEVTHWRYV